MLESFETPCHIYAEHSQTSTQLPNQEGRGRRTNDVGSPLIAGIGFNK